MTTLGRRLPHPLVSDPEAYGCNPTDFGPPVFGMPVLLKCKADDITVSAVPLPPQLSLPPPPSLPPPVAKCPHHNQKLINQMHGLLRTGAWQLDTLCRAQMAAQEASGVMAMAMSKLVDEEWSDL